MNIKLLYMCVAVFPFLYFGVLQCNLVQHWFIVFGNVSMNLLDIFMGAGAASPPPPAPGQPGPGGKPWT